MNCVATKLLNIANQICVSNKGKINLSIIKIGQETLCIAVTLCFRAKSSTRCCRFPARKLVRKKADLSEYLAARQIYKLLRDCKRMLIIVLPFCADSVINSCN